MQIQNLEASVTTFLAHTTPPCFLLVSPNVVCLEMAVESLAATHHWPVLTLGRTLSAVLMPTVPPRWGAAAARWLSDTAGQVTPGPLLVSHTRRRIR
jgi:hypothetical protein